MKRNKSLMTALIILSQVSSSVVIAQGPSSGDGQTTQSGASQSPSSNTKVSGGSKTKSIFNLESGSTNNVGSLSLLSGVRPRSNLGDNYGDLYDRMRFIDPLQQLSQKNSESAVTTLGANDSEALYVDQVMDWLHDNVLKLRGRTSVEAIIFPFLPKYPQLYDFVLNHTSKTDEKDPRSNPKMLDLFDPNNPKMVAELTILLKDIINDLQTELKALKKIANRFEHENFINGRTNQRNSNRGRMVDREVVKANREISDRIMAIEDINAAIRVAQNPKMHALLDQMNGMERSYMAPQPVKFRQQVASFVKQFSIGVGIGSAGFMGGAFIKQAGFALFSNDLGSKWAAWDAMTEPMGWVSIVSFSIMADISGKAANGLISFMLKGPRDPLGVRTIKELSLNHPYVNQVGNLLVKGSDQFRNGVRAVRRGYDNPHVGGKIAGHFGMPFGVMTSHFVDKWWMAKSRSEGWARFKEWGKWAIKSAEVEARIFDMSGQSKLSEDDKVVLKSLLEDRASYDKNCEQFRKQWMSDFWNAAMFAKEITPEEYKQLQDSFIHMGLTIALIHAVEDGIFGYAFKGKFLNQLVKTKYPVGMQVTEEAEFIARRGDMYAYILKEKAPQIAEKMTRKIFIKFPNGGDRIVRFAGAAKNFVSDRLSPGAFLRNSPKRVQFAAYASNFIMSAVGAVKFLSILDWVTSQYIENWYGSTLRGKLDEKQKVIVEKARTYFGKSEVTDLSFALGKGMAPGSQKALAQFGMMKQMGEAKMYQEFLNFESTVGTDLMQAITEFHGELNIFRESVIKRDYSTKVTNWTKGIQKDYKELNKEEAYLLWMVRGEDALDVEFIKNGCADIEVSKETGLPHGINCDQQTSGSSFLMNKKVDLDAANQKNEGAWHADPANVHEFVAERDRYASRIRAIRAKHMLAKNASVQDLEKAVQVEMKLLRTQVDEMQQKDKVFDKLEEQLGDTLCKAFYEGSTPALMTGINFAFSSDSSVTAGGDKTRRLQGNSRDVLGEIPFNLRQSYAYEFDWLKNLVKKLDRTLWETGIHSNQTFRDEYSLMTKPVQSPEWNKLVKLITSTKQLYEIANNQAELVAISEEVKNTLAFVGPEGKEKSKYTYLNLPYYRAVRLADYVLRYTAQMVQGYSSLEKERKGIISVMTDSQYKDRCKSF